MRLRRAAGAGDDLVGLAARVGEPLAVLAQQRVRLATAVFSAESIESSIIRWRLSSASAMRGNATFQRTNMVSPKTTSVQIINPMTGSTRPGASSPLASAASR